MVRLGTAAAIFLTAVSFAPGLVSAGETDSAAFRIQDYIPKRFSDFQWRLDGWVSSNDATQQYPNLYSSDTAETWKTIDRETSSSYLKQINSWRYRYETRQVQLDYSLGLTTKLSRDNYETTDTILSALGRFEVLSLERPENVISFVIPLRGETRRYLFSDCFLSLGGSFDYWYDEIRSRSTTTDYLQDTAGGSGWTDIERSWSERKSREVRRRIDFTGEIRLGWGRLYEGRFAASAIYVIDELRRTGLLLRQPDRDEMLQMTRQVHAYREGHSPDKREFRAQTIREILSELRSAGVVTDESVRAVLCVEDVLDYFPADERKFGWDVQAGFGGHDQYINNQQTNHYRNWSVVTRFNPDSSWIEDTVSAHNDHSERSYHVREFNPADHIVAKLRYSRPLNPRWQFDFSGTTWLYLNRNTSREHPVGQSGYSYIRTFDRRVVAVDAALKYLFDARTSFLLECALIDTSRTDRYAHYSTSWWSPPPPDTVEWKEHRRTFDLTVAATYRLSPSTTLAMQLLYTRYLTSTQKVELYAEERRNSTAFSAGITHWLF